jgi:hypothetical protein
MLGLKLGLPYNVVSSIKLWTPALISTSLWLDANDSSSITLNGSNVSRWNDKSGSGNHLTQASTNLQPTLNGNDIAFASNRTILRTNPVNTLNAQGTTSLFLVHNIIDATTMSGNFVTILRNSSNSSDPTKRRPFLIYSKSGDSLNFSNSVSTDANIGTTSTKVGKSVMSYTQSTTQATLYLGGNLQQQINNTPDTNTVAETFQLGNLSDTNNSMIFNEVVLVNNILSPDDRQKVEGYLAWKWGLTANLPIGHPYKDNPPLA